MNWISVTERLPDEMGQYICTSRWDKEDDYSVNALDYGMANDANKENDRVFENGYAFGENWCDGIDNIDEVIAWMEMPEPYKGDE